MTTNRHSAFLDRAERFAAEIGTTAIQRDQNGGVPIAERRLLRQSGLLEASLARGVGGAEVPTADVLQSVRVLGRADGSLAHVFAYHHLLLLTVSLFGTREQYARWARATVAERWLWGNALNPRDQRLTGVPRSDGCVLDGQKSFASGARDADVLVALIASPVFDRAMIVLPGDRGSLILAGSQVNADGSTLRRSC